MDYGEGQDTFNSRNLAQAQAKMSASVLGNSTLRETETQRALNQAREVRARLAELLSMATATRIRLCGHRPESDEKCCDVTAHDGFFAELSDSYSEVCAVIGDIRVELEQLSRL